MPTRTSVLALAVSLFVSAPARAAEFFVDPEAGSPDGDGSADAPWRTLEEVVEAGLIETRDWESRPYEEGAALRTVNRGAPVRAGDTLWLRSGYHGELVVEGAYNETPITIAAAPGARPELRRVLFRAAAGWVLRGVSISPTHAPEYEPVTLVEIDSHDWAGPSHDVVVEDCDLFSVDDASGWGADDWVANACNGFQVDGDRAVVRGNRLRNVRFGISVSGEHALVSHNLVENFSGDGLRGLGDHGVFEYNVVKNCYDVDENHDDGFQSWSVGEGGVGTGEVRGIVLRGNVIINYEDPDQPLRGTLQGIGCFDGFFVDWVVENNVIVTDHWHGITLLGARDSRVVNNTVLDPNAERPGPPWIQIGDHKDGRPSDGVVVRNNLVTDLNLPDGDGVTADHNLIIEEVDALFVDAAGGDLHLRPGSAAVDTGSAELAPALDIETIERPQGAGFDLGAYEWHEPGVEPADAGVRPPGDAGAAPDAGATGTDGGAPSRSDGGAVDSVAPSGEGCGCTAPGRAPGRGAGVALLLPLVLLVRARRRPSRPRPR